MKTLLTASIALALTTTAHASWFGPSQEVIDLKNPLAQQHSTSGFWTTVAACMALFAIITFIVGTVLGSRTRRNAKHTRTDGQ